MNELIDDETGTLVGSLVGRTITRAEWRDVDADRGWTEHEYALLWLDDGRVVRFGGWGYDAWGATVKAWRDGAD
jgi:hypothetical protein